MSFIPAPTSTPLVQETTFTQESLYILVENLLPFSAEVLLYGIYLVLICLCLYSLRARSYQGETKLHLLTMFTLFALSSAHITGIFVTMLPLMKASFGSLGDDGNEEDALMNFMKASVEFTTIGTAIYMTSNIIADAVLIYRCFVVWDMRRYILIAPVFFLLVNTGSAIAYVLPPVWRTGNSTTFQMMFFGSALAENLLVTCLIAGRIWWLRHKGAKTVGKAIRDRYTVTIAIILESGIIYPIFIVAFVVLALNSHLFQTLLAQKIVFAMLTQLVGMIPTLIMVRFALGVSTQSLKSSIALAREADRQAEISIAERRWGSPVMVVSRTEGGEPLDVRDIA